MELITKLNDDRLSLYERDEVECALAHDVVMPSLRAALERAEKAEEEVSEQKQRILSLIHERDRYKIEADRKFGMRKELEKLLGWPERSTNDEKEFKAAVKRLRDIKSENERLNKAVEWALTWTKGHPEWKWDQFEKELRKRAGMEEDGCESTTTKSTLTPSHGSKN